MPDWFFAQDKVVHASLYSVLGAALAWGRRGSDAPPAHWIMLGVGFAYGATDEFHQAFVRGRSPDWGDWAADVTGVLVGYTLMLALVTWLGTARSMNEEIDVSK